MPKTIDEKLQEYLSNASSVRRPQQLERTVDLLFAMTPSILSTSSHLIAETSPINAKNSNGTYDMLFNQSDENIENSSVISTDTVRGLVTLSQITTSVSDVLHERGVGTVNLLEEPLSQKTGETASHSFDTENGFVQIHVPGLHVLFDYKISPIRRTQLKNMTRQLGGHYLKMEMECLPSYIQATKDTEANTVDLEDGHWVETSVQEGALFSQTGILLERRPTALRLRARICREVS
jgi:hypothetical protein